MRRPASIRARQASCVGVGAATGADCMGLTRSAAHRYFGATAEIGLLAMEIREVMTESVVTATPDAPVRHVAELMRERNVGSVVLVGDDGLPVGFITDRDLAVSVLADGHPADSPAGGHASSPVVTGEPGMDVTEATKLMVDNGVRRLPIVDGDRLTGIVTLDDLAVRIGDLEIAASITAQVTRAALPGFYFFDRGG
jgi:CBS domain-containing protein